ncbi:hypothetical protein [Streptomyces caelestis]|uniref:hypothetical protein n=1 Tax=Streptomyces caelestis TaxID=36816 RepID=UPI0036F9E014
MPNFWSAVGLIALTTVVSLGWKVLMKPIIKPPAEDVAVGLELMVATMGLQLTYLLVKDVGYFETRVIFGFCLAAATVLTAAGMKLWGYRQTGATPGIRCEMTKKGAVGSSTMGLVALSSCYLLNTYAASVHGWFSR